MKKIIPLLLIIFSPKLQAQSVSQYFEKIRDNSAALTAFFSQMPKGGDLHHHYSGSIYAETYLNIAISKDYFVNTRSLQISETNSPGDLNWTKFSSLKNDTLNEVKQQLLQKWSIKDFAGNYPSHRQFFEAFNHFGDVVKGSIEQGLIELKTRAQKENVSYIETTLKSASCDKDVTDLYFLNDRLKYYQSTQDRMLNAGLLDSIYRVFQERNVIQCALSYNDHMVKLHTTLKLDDSSFTLRFQSFVNRINDPIPFFRSLVVAFEAANRNPLVVGVNIVAPEHNELSMRDYWQQMQMFNFCHTIYPGVKYSLHAGELTPSLVKPEDLTWHINAAVYDAKANRIGHGVDLPYEKDCYALLNYMSKHKIAVEINLGSNEFILNVKDDRHPILLYKNFGVPIAICTDDAGILRTNLTEQFVLLAKRYKQITYADIKRFVYNSVEYSFIKEAAVKQKLTSQLNAQFKSFEQKVVAAYKK
ncbi:MAG: hypothetical protein ABIN01_00060 [Ferruginibacter sp.]